MRRSSLLSLLGTSAFLLLPLLSHAATLSNGMPASDLLGQYDDSLTNPQPIFTKSVANNAPNIFGFSIASTNAIVTDSMNHRLFVTDALNNRVLVYNLDSSNVLLDRIPDVVLGQANFYTNAASTTQAGMNNPKGLAYDAATSRLYITDCNNSRILIFNTSSLSSGINASYVLGQATFTSSGTGTTQASFFFPAGITYDSSRSRLYVADTSNNRVLGFSGAAISNGMNAAYVLGQSNFTTSTSATTQIGMGSPLAITLDATTGYLFVADGSNRRVLVFTGATISNGMNAAYAIGQQNFTATTSATTQAGFASPSGVTYDAVHSHLFVADRANNRILVFSGASLRTGMSGAYVLGQSSFTTATTATTQSGMNAPRSVYFDSTSGKLFTHDTGNNRILIFNVSNITNGMPAFDVLGQYDDSLTNPQPVYTKSTANNGPNRLGFNIGGSLSFAVDGKHHKLFIPDQGVPRVTVYDLDAQNTLIDRIPDYVIGQNNFYASTLATTQSGLRGVTDIAIDTNHDRLFVADHSNRRVLVFDAANVSTGMNAQYVLGKSDFTSSGSVTVSQTNLEGAPGLAYDNVHDRLFVVTTRRILAFTGSALSNGMAAASVLGAPNFTTTTSAIASQTNISSFHIAFDSIANQLFVADHTWNRIMVFGTSSIVNGMSGSYVLGQTDFTSTAVATTQSTVRGPRGVAYDPRTRKLFVGDTTNNRVMVFDTTTLSNGLAATNVLGQPDFVTSVANTTQTGMSSPRGLVFDPSNQNLYVADVSNNRILIYDFRLTSSLVLTSSQSADANMLTLTATVSPSDAAGTVSFSDGSQSLGSVSVTSGIASLSLPAFSYTAGSHSFTASFSSQTHFSSTSDSISPTIHTTGTTTTTTGGGGGGSRRITQSVSSPSPISQHPSANISVRSVSSSARSSVRSPIRSISSTPPRSSVSSHSSFSSPSSFSSSIRFTTVNVHLRSLATIKSKAKTQLRPNTSITLLEVLTDWAKVRTKDGKEGYVLRKYLRK